MNFTTLSKYGVREEQVYLRCTSLSCERNHAPFYRSSLSEWERYLRATPEYQRSWRCHCGNYGFERVIGVDRYGNIPAPAN